MKTCEAAKLRTVLKQAGHAWLFDFWSDKSESALAEMSKGIDDFVDEYERRFHTTPDPFGLLEKNWLIGAAFFQPDVLDASVEMKIMVWRVLHGADITRVHLNYERDKPSSMTITLRSGNRAEEQYSASRWWDYRVLKHFNISAFNDHLVLEGFYPSQPPPAASN